MKETAERFADECDRACEIEREITEGAVRKVIAKIEKPPEDFDGMHCIECGNEIPEGRLKTGAFRDIQCQQRIEHQRKHHRSFYE